MQAFSDLKKLRAAVKINVDAASAPATARTSEHARGSARSASPSIVAALEDAKTLAGPRGHVAGNVHAYGVIGAPDKHGHAEGGASRSFLMQGPTGRCASTRCVLITPVEWLASSTMTRTGFVCVTRCISETIFKACQTAVRPQVI